MQDAGVWPGCRDRVVADGVAVCSCAAVEGPLHQALAARVRDDLVEVGNHIRKSRCRRGDREPHLTDLVDVFDQPEFTEIATQIVFRGGEITDLMGDRSVQNLREGVDAGSESRVGSRQHECGRIEGRQHLGELTQPRGLEPELGGDVCGRWSATCPELPDLRIGVKLVRVAAGRLTKVQRGVVASGCGHHHQYGSGYRPTAPARKVRKRGMCTIGVVGVVGTNFGRPRGNDEGATGVQLGDAAAAAGGEGRLLAERRSDVCSWCPSAADVVGESIGDRCG